MRKRVKSIIVAALCFVILSSFSMNAVAQESQNYSIVSGERVMTMEEYEEYLQNLSEYLYLTIAELQVPASIGIANTSKIDWFYETEGHSLVVNGIYSDFSAILIADPEGEREEGVPYFYEKSAETVNKYYTRIVF